MEQKCNENHACVLAEVYSDSFPASSTKPKIHAQVVSINPRDLKLCRSCGQLCFYLGQMRSHHARDSKTGVSIDSMPTESRPTDKVRKCSVTLSLEKQMEDASRQTDVHVGEYEGKSNTRVATPTTPEQGHKFKKNAFNAEERVNNVPKSSATAANPSQVSDQKPGRILRTRDPSKGSVSALRRRQSVIVAPSQESLNALQLRARSRTLSRSRVVKASPSSRLSACPQENANKISPRVQQNEFKGKTTDSLSAPSAEGFLNVNLKTARTPLLYRRSKSKIISQAHNSTNSVSRTNKNTSKEHGAALTVSEEDFQRHMRSMAKTTSSSSEESFHTISSARNPSPQSTGKSHQSPVSRSPVAGGVYRTPPGRMSSTAKDVPQKRKIIVRNPNSARRNRSAKEQAKTRASCELYILEDGVSQMERKQCDICQRWFDVNRVDAHKQICQRLADVEAEKKSKAKKTKKRGSVSTNKPDKGKPLSNAKAAAKGKDSDWRRKHEDFINTLRSAKLLSAHLAAGGKASDLPPPPPSDTSDYVQCPHCSRKFCAGSAERHIRFCETQNRSRVKLPMPRAMSMHRK